MNNVEWRVVQAESGFAPLTTIDLMKWRRKAAIVVQDPPIFNATVRENIAWPDTVPDEDKVRFAAEVANVNEFLDDSPDGLGTMCLERGARFSGGQRQRIALARALYRWPELLVLHEATSALDRESVGVILERLKFIKLTGVTCIVITHDRRLTELADRTFIVDNRRLKIQSRDVG